MDKAPFVFQSCYALNAGGLEHLHRLRRNASENDLAAQLPHPAHAGDHDGDPARVHKRDLPEIQHAHARQIEVDFVAQDAHDILRAVVVNFAAQRDGQMLVLQKACKIHLFASKIENGHTGLFPVCPL